MNDYEHRPRRGGGTFNNRKRRYQDDDYGAQQGGQRHQRRRYEEPLATTLRKQVLAIAETMHRRVEEDITTIAKTITENYFDTDLTNTFLDLAVALSLEQPMKIPFVAAIVLTTNTQKPEFTEEVLKRIGDSLQNKIDQGCWRDVKLLLRFLACLQGLYQGDGVFAFLEEIFTRAAELQTESSEDALGLELTKIILFTIAYTMSSSATGYETQANSLLEKTDIIASTPHLLENLVDPFPSSEQGAPLSHESALSLMQKHMTKESTTGWQVPCLPKPWKALHTPEEEELFNNAQKHQFPALELPAVLQLGPRPIFPEVYFSVYDTQDIATVPPADDPVALLIRDCLNDTINVMHFNRNISAKALIDLDNYFAANTFVKRATAFDKLREITADNTTWKPEDVIVDATFAQIMQLPHPDHKLVYYHSVLTESCKLAPAAVAPSLGRAIRYFFRNIERLDLELNRRFLDWFAHHLSNFGFTWKWIEWVDQVDQPDVDPKKAFILDALDKEIRLSFAQRIKGTLPDQYKTLIPPETEQDSPAFKFADQTAPFHTQVQELIVKIRGKADESEIRSILTAIETAATESTHPAPALAALDAYTTTLVHIGSKSLSHSLAIIERSRPLLLSLSADDTAARKQIITSITSFWQFQIGTALALIDKLLNYELLQPLDIVEWALIDNIDRGAFLAKGWCYELVTNTTTKVVKRVRQLVFDVRDPSRSDSDRASVQTTLDHEINRMKTFFTTIEDALSSVATMSEDGMIESSDQLHAEQDGILKEWGAKWVRFIRRRAAVEENWVREELAKPLPPAPLLTEVKPEETDEKVNGGGDRNGRHQEQDA